MEEAPRQRLVLQGVSVNGDMAVGREVRTVSELDAIGMGSEPYRSGRDIGGWTRRSQLRLIGRFIECRIFQEAFTASGENAGGQADRRCDHDRHSQDNQN